MSRSLSEHERGKLAAEIGGLQSLEVEQLKGRWGTLYGTEAPARFSRDLLIGAVAYRTQKRAWADLNRPPAACSSAWPPMRMLGDHLNLHRSVRSNQVPY
jgi:hypothetical protein